MAIFRGTTGTGSSDNTIVSAVTEQAGIATTKASEAEGFRDEAEGFKNTASSQANLATTKANEASADASGADSQRQLCVALRLEAYDSAQDALASANAAEASATTANSSAVQTVAGSNTQVVGVYNNIANVNTVAGVNTDVTTVAGISSDVTTVAADASDIGTVSTNIANVNNVGNNIANVNAVHGNASNINTVAADGTDIGTVATNIANVNTVAGISSTVTTVAGLESKMDTVIADASDIGAVAGNIGDVTTVAGINSDVDTVAGIAAKVTTVADNISDVQNADTNATNAASSASNASASATSASNSATTATTKATEASNSATAASNSATTATTKASQAAGSATTAGTSASTATTKASEASASATTATTKAGEAASSASAASGSATTATTKAAEADASATSAASSATNSSNAASTWNNFYNSYLGVADAPPSVDVLGNPIVAGALYYDTGAGSNAVGLYVYNGSSWVYSTNYNNVTAPYTLAQNLNADGNNITAVGSLGIGTSSPSANLHVSSSGDTIARITSADGNSAFLDLGDASDPDGGRIVYDSGSNLALYTASTERMRINSSGNVGIGTTSPANDLHISSATGSARLTSTGGGANVYMESADNNNTRIRWSSNANFAIRNDTTATDVVTINQSGRVGIGTTSPAQKAHVSGAGTQYLRVENTTNSVVTDFGTSSTGSTIINRSAHPISFYTDSTERMRIDSSGNVGIGVTSPTGKVQIYKGGQSSYQTYTNTNSGLILQSYQSQGNPYTKTSDIVAGSDGTVPSEIRLLTRTAGSSSVDERLRIDSSGRVGIGTTSPSKTLTVGGSGLRVQSTTSADFYSTGQDALIVNNGTANFKFWNNGSERLRIDSSGKVGIGTSNPNRVLHVEGTATTFGSTRSVLQIADDTAMAAGVGGGILFTGKAITGQGDSNTAFAAIHGLKENGTSTNTAGAMLFSTRTSGSSPSERMRIDSSGNLLVGKTTTSNATAGAELNASGQIVGTFANGTHILGRNSSDGSILEFRKDGSTVGSIGTISNDLTIGSTDTRIRFDDNGAITPRNSSDANSDSTIDLGQSGGRFKDLYLSGGVHLGGTGTANKLDDYEEGTWTPVIYGSTGGTGSGTVAQARYTKVGGLVQVQCYLHTYNVTGLSGNVRMSGLPFPAYGYHPVVINYASMFSFDEADISVSGYTESGSSHINLTKGSSTAILPTSEATNSAGALMMNFSYYTSS